MTRRPLLLSVPVLVFVLAAAVWAADAPDPEVRTRDLVIVPVQLPKPETPQQGQAPPQAEASINWTDGILRVTGRGRPSARAKSEAQRWWTAKEAAQLYATRNLGFALSGAPVTSDQTLEEYVKKLGGQVTFQFRSLRYDRMRSRDLPDGVVEVTLELFLRGKRDLAEALYGAGGDQKAGGEPKPKLRPAGAGPIEGLTATGAKGPFTGLVVVADGLDARPVLRVQLYDSEAKRVYGPGVASMDAAAERGLAAYVRSPAAAKEHAQVGANPLVVRAAGTNARNAGELFLSQDDAGRVRAAEKQSGFLKRAAVAIVLDRRE